MNTEREQQAKSTPGSSEKLSEDQPRKNALEETRSFLNNLPQVRKPQTKRSIINEHLAFLDNLPSASAKKPAEPDPVQTVTLEGIREIPLDVHEGTESPNKKTQKPVAVNQSIVVLPDEPEQTEELVSEIPESANVVSA
jgi:hypothetical protein